jgi:hypothetical protein
VRTTVTDGSGEYRFPTLPPGKYAVKAELTGRCPGRGWPGSIGRRRLLVS